MAQAEKTTKPGRSLDDNEGVKAPLVQHRVWRNLEEIRSATEVSVDIFWSRVNPEDKIRFKGDRPCIIFNSFQNSIWNKFDSSKPSCLDTWSRPNYAYAHVHTSDSFALDLRPNTNFFQFPIILLSWSNIVSEWTCETIFVVNRFNLFTQDFYCYYSNTSIWWIAFTHWHTSPMYSTTFLFMLLRQNFFKSRCIFISFRCIDGKDACASCNIKIHRFLLIGCI